MLTFSPAQMNRLGALRTDGFAADMAAHLRRFAPRHAGALGEDGLAAAVGFGLTRARARGFGRRGPARLWLETSMILGGFWDDSPLFAPLFAPALARAGADPMDAARGVWSALDGYVAGTLGRDRAPVRRALTGLRALAEATPPAGPALAPWLLAEAERSFPERWRALGPDAHRALVLAALTEAADFGATEARHGALWVVLALTLGHGFARDPFSPWAGHVLGNAALGPPAARLERLASRARLFLDAALAAV